MNEYTEGIKINLVVHDRVLSAITDERVRQEQLRMSGKFTWTCLDKLVSNSEKLAVLAEEFGEVSKEIVEQLIANSQGCTVEIFELFNDKIKKELVQVAAICVAWLESFYGRGK